MPVPFAIGSVLGSLLLATLLAGPASAADAPAAPAARISLTERNRLWNDARLLESQGKLAESLAAANKVLTFDRAKYGAGDQRVAVSLDYIGKLNLAKGDFAAAREALGSTVKIWSALPGVAAWRVTDAKLALAEVDVLEKLTPAKRGELAKTDAAELAAEQTLRDGKFDAGAAEAKAVWQSRQAILGADNRRTVTSELLLANCLARAAKYAEAQPLLEHVRKMRLALLGAEHPDTATVENYLAKNFEALKQYSAAVEHYQAALAGRRKALGDQATDTRATLAALADATALVATLHEQAGRWDDARTARQAAIDLFIERYGEQDSRVTDGRLALADVERLAQLTPDQRAQLSQADVAHDEATNTYFNTTKYDEASAKAQSAWEVRQKLLGADHRKTVTTENLLANCLYSQSKYDDAEPHYQHVLEVRLKLLGTDHTDTASAYNNLGGNCYYRKRYEDAVANHRSALSIRRKLFGSDAADTKKSLESLANALASSAGEYETAERWEAARKAQQEVATLRSERWGEQDSRAVDARWALNDIDLIAKLSADQRGALAKADVDHNKAINLYSFHSKYEEARTLIKPVWELRKQILGADHRNTLLSENLLANCLYSLGKYAEAEPLYGHVLEQRLALLGAEHAETANSYFNIAGNYYYSARYEQAVANHRTALAIRRKVLGADNDDTKVSLASLGDALAAWAGTQEKALRWDAARKAREEIVSLRIERYGEKDHRVTDAQMALGDIDRLAKFDPKKRTALAKADEAQRFADDLYYSQSKYEPALATAKTAWDGRKELLGPDHKKTISSENLLGHCFYSLNKYSEAEPLYQHVLDVRTKTLGEDHPDTASSHGNLARNCYWYEKYDESVKHHRATLATRRKLLGNQSNDTRQSMSELADALVMLAPQLERADKFDDARSAWDEALALRIERYGDSDGRVADVRLALADLDRFTKLSDAERQALRQADADHQAAAKLYIDQSQYSLAIERVKPAWESRRTILGEEHRKTLQSENLLANCLYSSEKYAEAEPHYQHVLQSRLKLLGPDHIDVATSHNNLAKNCYYLHRYPEAIDGHRAALAIRQKALGDQSADTQQCLADLADALSEQATLEERADHLDTARPLRDEALALRIKRYGDKDYHVADTRLVLADLDLLGKLSPQQRVDLFAADDAHQAAINLYFDQAKYDQALEKVQAAFEGRKTILGAEHRKTLVSENLLANCYYSLNRYAEAEPHYRHALEVRGRTLGAEHPDTANAHNNLGRCLQGLARYQDAAESFRTALAIRQKVLGSQANDTKTSLVDLADDLASLASEHEKEANWDAARTSREEVLSLRKQRYGDADYRVTDARLVLEDVELYSGFSDDQRALVAKADEAYQATANSYAEESTYIHSTAEARRIIETRKAILGPEHRRTLQGENLLANCLYSSEKYADAEPLYQHVADTRLKIFGPNHPDTAVAYVNLAKALYWQRRYAESVANHRIGLATRRKVLGNQAVDTRQSLVDLGDALSAMAGGHEAAGHWDEARAARQEVVALRAERYGPDDGRVADARQAVEDVERMKGLSEADRAKLAAADAAYLTGSKLYTDESKYAAAEPEIRASLEGRKAILGDENRKTLQCENLLANCLYGQRKYADAEPFYQHVLDVRKRLLGEEHVDTALSFSNLAKDFYSQRQYQKAATNHRAALAIRRKVLGSDGYDTRQTMIDLADALASLAAEQETAENSWDAAKASRADVLALRTERFGERDWHATDARVALEETAKLAGLSKEERERLATADQLHSKASDAYADDSDYVAASDNARKAWQERSALLGPDSRKALRSENLLANCLFARAIYGEAQEHYQHEIDLQLQRLGPDHPDYATSLNNLSSLYKAIGQYAKAEPLLKQVVALRRRAYGEDNADYASSLNNLAQLYYSTGRYDEAEPLLLQALATRKKVLGTENADYATSLNNLAYFHFSKGNYAKAEELYLEALAIRKRVVGEQHSDYAINLNELASLYESMGDFAKAEPLLTQTLAIRKKMVGENHPDYAATLSSLASLYYSKGDYAKAEPLYEKALAIRKQALGEEHRDYASSLNSLANLYYSASDYARAEPLYLKVLAIRKKVLGEGHPEYASSLNNLGSLYQAMGDYARAEPLYLQSSALWRKVYGGDTNPENLNHPSYATSLNNLANLYQAKGESAKAEPLYRQALEIRKKVLGTRHPDYSQSVDSLANLYYSRGDYAHAEPLFQEALSIRQQVLGPNHPDCATCLSKLARLYENRGEFALADPLALEALEITERHLELTSNVQSERQQLLMNQSVRSYLDTYLSISAETAPPADQIHGEVLRWKGAVWARQQSLRHWRQALAEDKDLSEEQKKHSLDTLADLETASRQLATLSRATPSAERAEEYRQQIADLSGKIESLQRELAQLSADFRTALAQQQTDSATISQCLPEGTSLVDLIEYWRYFPSPDSPGKGAWQRQLAAFVLRPGQPVARLELGSVPAIRDAVVSWREHFAREHHDPDSDTHAVADPAGVLRRMVWEHLAPALGDAKTVLVSPDGVLSQLPWAALPGSKPETYLLEEGFAFAIVPVPRLLPELLSTHARAIDTNVNPALALVGDVDYGAAPGATAAPMAEQVAVRAAPREDGAQSWPKLEATRMEILAVQDSFANADPDERSQSLRKDKATEERVRALAPKCRYIHFATHGYFADGRLKSTTAAESRADVRNLHPGLLSGLVLAGANQPVDPEHDDGILTALEVQELDLSGMELATLSACQTGLGKSISGEGALGLQRAFQIAGARTVVASLWLVEDKAGRQLMSDFYENLWQKKLPKIEALRQAQLSMLANGISRGLVAEDDDEKSKTTQRVSPYYWGMFVLSGDWR